MSIKLSLDRLRGTCKYIIDRCNCSGRSILQVRISLEADKFLVLLSVVSIKGLKILHIIMNVSLEEILDCRKNATVRHILQPFFKATDPALADVIRV